MAEHRTQPLDYSAPVEIAPQIWWVGHVLKDNPFQCHVYLIENGEDSILIDPGSKLTWKETRKKILQRMPLEHIRYIVCQHQDPDITSAVSDLLDEIGTEGRKLVTHWRAQELLEHYNWGIEFYGVSASDWLLEAGNRKLKFVFTPYMHFPGNFCTFDLETRILFSSDIFGAITEHFALFAENADTYFEQMKPFHTHYMPASEIVNRGLDAIEKCQPIHMIAPQHGSIITKEMIASIIHQLRNLPCGIFLEYSGSRRVEMMTKINELLPDIFETAAYFDSFQADSRRIIELMKNIFPIDRIFALSLIDNDHFIRLDSKSPVVAPCKWTKEQIFKKVGDILQRGVRRFVASREIGCLEDDGEHRVYLFPVTNYEKDIIGVGMFVFESEMDHDDEVIQMLEKFEKAISIIASREIEIYRLEDEKRRVYNMAITDNLTGLYNRYYLDEMAHKEMAKAKRYGYTVSVVYLDIDHFKRINDRYGHDVGDLVLKRFAQVIQNSLRESDTAFRLGGEEFLILMPYTHKEQAADTAERIKEKVKKEGCVTLGSEELCYTFSGGAADSTEVGADFEELQKLADARLYEAKKSGRDRILV